MAHRTRAESRALPLVFLLATGLFVGCRPADRPGPDQPSPNAVVLTGEVLSGAPGGVLEAMRARVPNMQVLRAPAGCPRISFRGVRSLEASVDPRIYVEGTEMKDTCILDQIRTIEVDVVEVYVNGFTDRPGYRGSPNGLILVFLKGG